MTKNIITLDSLNKHQILNLFKFTKAYYESNNKKKCLKLMFPTVDTTTKVLVTAFFEPSTRTQLSFESAMYRIGGTVVRFNKDTSSIKKGESFTDTIKTLENYGDIMVIRHPEKGILNNIENIISTPVINGGDGDGEHPTQALLDLFCIWMKFNGVFYDKVVVLYGDCNKSRTIRSLSKLLDLFNVKYYYLAYPDRYILNNSMNINLEQLNEINPDVLYITRMQHEREQGTELPENMKVNTDFIARYISEKKIETNKFLILHPLPRNDELDVELDNEQYSGYFKAMDYSVYLRGILICMVLENKMN